MIKRLFYIAVSLLLVTPVIGTGKDTEGTKFTDFTVLWDRASGEPECTPGGAFEHLGNELLAMGASITELTPGQLYRDDILEDVDLVIICLRYVPLGPLEQEALVRYVRNGGSLLVICSQYPIISQIYPVIINFGIEVMAGFSPISKLNAFVHPATTDRRPVELCKTMFAHKINCHDKAKAIAGNNPSGPSETIKHCFLALGGRSGKGRVIVASTAELWSTRFAIFAPPPIFISGPFWNKADNADLFRNTAEYLLGASDLQLKKLISKDNVSAGKSTTFKAKVKNLEMCYSRPGKVAFFLSQDDEFQPAEDTELGSVQIPEIRGHRTKLVKLNEMISDGVEPGEYYLFGVINPDSDPLEINSENNVKMKIITVN